MRRISLLASLSGLIPFLAFVAGAESCAVTTSFDGRVEGETLIRIDF